MRQDVSNRRLLRLATFLKTVPKERFDFSHWVGRGWDGRQDLSCGTTACALGWAATIPFFRRLGLRLARYGENIGYVTCGDGTSPYWASVAAAQMVFGLNYDEVEFIFIPNGWIGEIGETCRGEIGLARDATPREVARHIERFVRLRKPIEAEA